MPEPSSPDLTVIVPVFDAERWLPACLSSLEHQTMRSWVAIVVIDGATDRSEEVARSFAVRDARFTVLSTPNHGVGHARNVGLEHADTEYISFLDADDLLPPEALAVLIRAMTPGTDIVAAVGEDLFLDGATQRYWTQRGDLYCSAHDGLTTATEPQTLDDLVVWGKLYRRALIEEHRLRFPAGVHCEDVRFAAESFLAARSIATRPTVVYRHRRHDEAISTDYLREKTFADWMEQSLATFGEIERSGTPLVQDHYIARFISQQWWTRARAYDRFTPEQARSFQEFSARVHELARSRGSATERSLPVAALAFAARRMLSTPRIAFNPLPEDSIRDSDSITRAIAALRSIEVTEPADADLIAAVLVERLIDPVASGAIVLGPDAVLALVGEVDMLVERIGRRVFAAWAAPSHPESTERSGRELAIDRLNAREPLPTVLDELTTTTDGVLLRGSTRFRVLANELERAELVLCSQSSPKVRTVPVSGRGTQPFVWEALVPASPEFEDEEWRVWIRFHRAFGVREVLLPDEPVVAPEHVIGTGGGQPSIRAALIRGQGLEFLMRRTR